MAVDPTWWGAMGIDGGSATGFAGVETRPYTILSRGSSYMAQKVLDDAAQIFPEFDGVTNKAVPLPADYANPDFGSFVGWHTAHQIQYLKEQVPDWKPSDTVSVTFGTSVEPVDNETFLLTADGLGVIHVNQLKVTDIARLPLTDQERLAEIPAFRALFSNPLGWWPADAVPASTGRAPPATSAEARARLKKEVLDAFASEVTGAASYQGLVRDTKVTAANIATAYPLLFLDQIDIIATRIDNMGVFNPDVIVKMIADLKERYERIEKYANVTQPSTVATTGLTASANSTDRLASVARALNVFLGAELRLHDIVASSIDIIFSGKYLERVVDTPIMVFLFQAQENNSAEAEAQAKSEELNQMKALIGTYTKMQKIINDTLQKFNPVAFQEANKDNDKALEKKKLMGVDTVAELKFGADDLAILSMFEKLLAPLNNNTYLPVESATNAARPSFDFAVSIPVIGNFVPLKEHSQQEWDLFSQSLSKVSKVLSADSQARMDEIDRLSRGKNRNYELASDTLNKMTDILKSIVN